MKPPPWTLIIIFLKVSWILIGAMGLTSFGGVCWVLLVLLRKRDKKLEMLDSCFRVNWFTPTLYFVRCSCVIMNFTIFGLSKSPAPFEVLLDVDIQIHFL